MKESQALVDQSQDLLETEKVSRALFNKMITLLTQAIEVWDENDKAFYHRGVAHRENEMYQQAIDDFTSVVTLKEDDPAGYEARASVYERLRRWDDCIADYTSVISLSPHDDFSYNRRGLARMNRRLTGLKLKNADYASVLEDFSKAISLNPQNSNAYCNRGNARYDRGELRRAVDDFTRAITVRKSYTYAYQRRGQCHLDVVQSERQAAREAQEKYEADLEESERLALPKIPPTVEATGPTAEQQAEWESLLRKALEDFNQVVLDCYSVDKEGKVVSDADPQVYLSRGHANFELGLAGAAASDYEKAMALNPNLGQLATVSHRMDLLRSGGATDNTTSSS
eukprot:NODE_2175_length_1182_cov_26.082966_g1803_i0.p1 GENE.NODE_2175_length_1182_cov_26.082966_g1803_i0~~NODE_2175_length_1182_cov_26.082966_g1803_i0.p1  ORF type:complete len:381 (+),score=66.75 NODE_2175_length_1182_cov_26.082966_g1803_i0:121-1143(+)